MDFYVPHTYFFEIGWYLFATADFSSRNGNISPHKLKFHISVSKLSCYVQQRTHLYQPNGVRVLQVLLRRTQNSVLERDAKIPVLLFVDELCSVHMNRPKQQVRMHHHLRTTKHKRTGNVSIFLTFKYKGSFQEGVITP